MELRVCVSERIEGWLPDEKYGKHRIRVWVNRVGYGYAKVASERGSDRKRGFSFREGIYI
jgi:hypothetical protein